MISQCPFCGGQNAMHFAHCTAAPAMPRVSALRTSLPRPTAPGKLPYMHQQRSTGHEAIFGTDGSMGRVPASDPQTQNLPGTPAYALEMCEAMRGLVTHEGSCHSSGNKVDPSARLSTCPAKDETLMMKVSLFVGRIFTHRDKGGRYTLDYICKPAGEMMRKVGTTVIYHDVHSRQVYCRDIEDFVRIMQPLD